MTPSYLRRVLLALVDHVSPALYTTDPATHAASRADALEDALTVLGIEFDLHNRRNALVAAVIAAAHPASTALEPGRLVDARHCLREAIKTLDAFDAKLAADEPPHVNGLVQGATVDARELAHARTKTTNGGPPPLETTLGTRQNTCCRCGWGMVGPWDGASLCTSCGGDDGPTIAGPGRR